MRELLHEIRYDSLAKCHLYKSETNVFLEIVELVSELARCIVLKTRRYIFICIYFCGYCLLQEAKLHMLLR